MILSLISSATTIIPIVLGLGYVIFMAIRAFKNEKLEETKQQLNNVKDSKKIANSISNMDDIELNDSLQKYTDK